MTITICEEEFILAKERALFLPKQQLLAISDLHLGKSAHFRKAGLQIPSTLAQSDLQRLSTIIDRYAPKTLLVNGDMFHQHLNSDIDDFARWKNDYQQLEFILIKGNHDQLADKHYQDLEIQVYEPSYCTDKFCFIHDSIHCEKDTLYPITGHVHPGVTVIGKAKQRLRFPCFYFGKEFAVLPAFSAFTGLYPIKANKEDSIYAITPNKVIKV